MRQFLEADRPASYRKTKIVVSVGPASRSPEMIRALILAGVNVFRLNFSHSSPDEHLESLTRIRAISDELGMPVAILQDLGGPKIRISNIEGDFVAVPDGASVLLRHVPGAKSSATEINVEGLDPAKVLRPGQQVLLADGILELKAEDVTADGVRATVVKGGRLRSRVGIAFPDSDVELPATTEKDFEDLAWGIDHSVDYVAISFVKSAKDVLMVREAIRKEGGDLRIVAKIERKSALQNIYEIMDVSDGVMVARGDLGLELPLEQLPMIQKRIIEEANYRGIPVIVATQMLHSMITSVRPTRAEVSDIAAAVMHGADAVMLSEETTIGQHPLECVRYLDRIVSEAERSFAFEEYKLRLRNSDRSTVPDSVAYAASAAANKVGAAVIIACTETGNSARLVAKYRPQQPLYGVAHSDATVRRMCLFWGIRTLRCPSSANHLEEIETAIRAVQIAEDLPNGARAVITGGAAVGMPGSTSILEIRDMLTR